MGGTWSLVGVTLESAYVITVSYQLLIYKEDDAVVDDERLFLVFLLLIDGWDLELGGRPGRGRCLQIFF